MVQTDKKDWKEKHWWIDKQDQMLMVTASEQFKALPYHNMLESRNEVNGIDTSIVKQDAKNSLFFNREKNFGSLQSREYEEGKTVIYANCKLDDAVSRMRTSLLVKQEEVTPLRKIIEESVQSRE